MIFIKVYALQKFLNALDVPRFQKSLRELLGEYINKDSAKITVVFMNFMYDGSQGLDNAFFVETSIQGSMSGQEIYIAPYCKKAIHKILDEPGMTSRRPEKIEMFPLHRTSLILPEDQRSEDDR